MSVGKDKFEKLALDLQAAESDLRAEAEKRELGQAALGAGEQVEIMLKQVAIMRAQVESRAVPPVEGRIRGMARMVVDSWPMDSALGDRLISIEQAYLKLS